MAALTETLTLPVVALHDTVIFPGMVLPLRIGRSFSVRAVETAQAQGGKVLLLAEREPTPEIEPEKLHRVGTIGQVAQLLRLPDGTYQALIQGLTRARGAVGCWAATVMPPGGVAHGGGALTRRRRGRGRARPGDRPGSRRRAAGRGGSACGG